MAPCENDTTAVSLLIQNCSCPSVAITNPGGNLCSASDALDLNTLVLTSEPGSWTIVGTPPGTKPAAITGSQFVTSGSDAGTYRIRFTLDQPINGCPSWSESTITVIASPVVTMVSVKCADDLQTWQAVVTSTSPVLSSSLGTVVPLGGNQYRIEQIALLTSIQVTATTGNGLCTATIQVTPPDCACTLSISNLPAVVDVCPGDTYTLQGEVHDPKGNVTVFWIVDQDSVFQPSLTVNEAGSYAFVAMDELGCRESQVVDVNYYSVMVPGISWVDITCPGDHDGMIIVQDILGGTGPYSVSINGAPGVVIDAFPYFIEGLGAGTYHLQFFDAVNCSSEAEIDIHSASSETLSLGPDLAILVGDSVYINPILSFTPASFTWSGDNDQLLQPNQLGQWIHPETDQYFELTATDDKGCVYTDDLKVRALLTSAIYVPNVFSPNGDGTNDLLAPMTDPSITMIEYFRIYSRWGELVYSAENFIPNQTGFGWNGQLRNEYLQPGVFTYILAAVNKRGATYTKYGDVTLVR
jgi:gliding motility-associated-like protein